MKCVQRNIFFLVNIHCGTIKELATTSGPAVCSCESLDFMSFYNNLQNDEAWITYRIYLVVLLIYAHSSKYVCDVVADIMMTHRKCVLWFFLVRYVGHLS